MSGPIDFVVVVVAFECCYDFSNFVYCNRWNAESTSISKFALAEFFKCGGHSYSFRTSVSCSDEVSFCDNERKCLLKESGVMFLTELLDCGRDFLVISLTARQIVAVSLLSVISLLT